MEVNKPGKCGLGSGRVFEMRAWAKYGPGGLNLEIFFAVLRGVAFEKAHNCLNFLLEKVFVRKFALKPFFKKGTNLGDFLKILLVNLLLRAKKCGL